MMPAGTIDEVRTAIAQARQAGKTIGLVPTMGALHEGHLSLIEAARDRCGFVVVSIFVNPTQFAPGEDLAAYPRTPQADLAACEARGVDVVFMPDFTQMYPDGCLTEVTVGDLGTTLCGAGRPTHFAGVCTVVAKLFNVVAPDYAFFGAKDFQQATIIQRMVADLNIPVEIVVCPTVRGPDGLAMSSRNAYLEASQRAQAASLYESLCLAERMIRQSRPAPAEVVAAMRQLLAERAPDGQVEYVEIVDPQTLKNVQTTQSRVLVALAVKIGPSRLIDNIVVDAAD